MQLFQELQRRNVVRVTIGYIVSSWLLIQVADVALDNFGSPDWVMRTIVLVLALGLPVVVFFSWAYEVTPEGLKRESEVDRSQSITHVTGRKLDRAITAVLILAVGYFAYDKYFVSDARNAEATEPVTQEAPVQTPPDAVVTENTAAENGKSIAVLPFVDMSPAKDQEYFTDGLTENLLHALAQIPEIKVTGRTSSFAFKGRNEDLRSIGVQLNVQNILEGSVQKAGNQIRITAQLIDTSDGFHLWSETFDRKLDDIFAVQDEITAAVVSALRKSILGEEEIATGYSGDFGAYNAYLRGQFYDSQNNYEGWGQAIEQYRLAIDMDPSIALAWAGLSNSIGNQTGFSGDFAEGYEQARQAAQKALELDPELPEAHLALAYVQRSRDWDWAATERSLRRALELRPGDPDIRARLAELMAIRGDIAGALLQVEQVLSQDPLNIDVQIQRVEILLALDRHAEAVAGAQHLMEIQPQRGGIGALLSRAYHDRGEYQLALEAAQKDNFPFFRLTYEAINYQALGDGKTAESSLAQLVAEAGDDVSFQVAAIYSHWGDFDRAFAVLERGYAIRDPGLILIQLHTDFDPLREDPRYDAFLKKMGMR